MAKQASRDAFISLSFTHGPFSHHSPVFPAVCTLITMSTNATSTGSATNKNGVTHEPTNASPSNKGKGKDVQEEEEDEEMEEDSLEEIDPSAIRSRRTRGVRVDYTSAEALAKAGLKPGEGEGEDEEMH
ncbi:unnamed protein product [Somion occarium]|uniref:Histone chaperone domain-containing protein n=1 Tax=Somion occarium TaxID=3059160 RepID=A0ABP1DF41_9APHY